MIEASIVIPVLNKFSFTKSALNDLFELDQNTNEIIVIDNASTDETEKQLTSSFYIDRKNFIYIRNNENLFHSKACNIGFEKSTGNNIVFLNNDIRVRSNKSTWTKEISLACEKGIIGPSMGLLNNHFDFVKKSNSPLPGKSYLEGWCLASSRANWSRLTKSSGDLIWNENLPFYFNDVDLSWRAKKANIKLDIIDFPIVHFGKVSAQSLNISKLYLEGKKIFVDLWYNKDPI